MRSTESWVVTDPYVLKCSSLGWEASFMASRGQNPFAHLIFFSRRLKSAEMPQHPCICLDMGLHSLSCYCTCHMSLNTLKMCFKCFSISSEFLSFQAASLHVCERWGPCETGLLICSPCWGSTRFFFSFTSLQGGTGTGLWCSFIDIQSNWATSYTLKQKITPTVFFSLLSKKEKCGVKYQANALW